MIIALIFFPHLRTQISVDPSHLSLHSVTHEFLVLQKGGILHLKKVSQSIAQHLSISYFPIPALNNKTIQAVLH